MIDAVGINVRSDIVRQLPEHMHAFGFQLRQDVERISSGGVKIGPLLYGPRGLANVLHRIVQLGNEAWIDAGFYKVLLQLIQVADRADDLL